MTLKKEQGNSLFLCLFAVSSDVGTVRLQTIIYSTFTKEFRYDAEGRVSEEIYILDGGGSYSVSYSYDQLGRLQSTTGPDGTTTTYHYDLLGRRMQVDDPSGSTTFGYDTWGNLASLTDAANQRTEFVYDTSGRLTQEIRPMQQSTSYEYDTQGRLQKILDAKNQTTEYGYDSQGRIETITYDDGRSVTLSYDANGNLAGYDDGVTSASYTYDAVGRKLSETVNYGAFSKTFSYSYYANGLKKSFTAPDGTVYEYMYGANNELREVRIPGLGSITISEYQWNRPKTMRYPGGSTREYEYDALMRLTRLVATDPGGNSILDYSYDYDSRGNIVSKTTEHGTYSYGYDGASRLTSVDNPGLDDESYSYDAVGNRTAASNAAGNISHNANNELTVYGDVEYVYDANGNITEVTLSGQVMFTYHYNADNRLMKAEGGNSNTIAKYSYDPFGRRLWKEVSGVRTYFFYSDEGLIGEYDASGTEIRTYGYKPNSTWMTDPLWLKQGTEYYFYQNDHLGTPQKLTAVNGAVVWSATYSAFGQAYVAIETVTNHLRLPGQYFDGETGLHYNWNRYYDAGTGRYIRKDPIGVLAGINTFTYAANNSLTKNDPLGLWVELDKIVPPEEAFTAIEQAILARNARLPNVSFRLYKTFYDYANADMRLYGNPILQEYLDSIVVAAQAVQPAWEGTDDFVNRFVFTCKYGWIDVGHFFAMALMGFTFDLPTTLLGSSGSSIWSSEIPAMLPYYIMTALIESGQAVHFLPDFPLSPFHGGVLELFLDELSPTAQSAGAAEDFESNWQGALFTNQLLGEYISDPSSAMGAIDIIHQWDKFLYDAQAITFKGQSDIVYRTLYDDVAKWWEKVDGNDVYIGPRWNWDGWEGYKDQSAAYCIYCNGDRAKPNVRTYKPTYGPYPKK